MALSPVETLRRNRQKLKSEEGSLYDYLDRGRPKDEDRLKAHGRISEIEVLLEPLIQKYAEEAEKLAAADPEAFRAWCDRHESTTLRMEKETGDSTGQFVARDIREQWRKFQEGNYQWFSINSYFLRGYDGIFDSLNQ